MNVVLLHALPVDHRMWDAQLPVLAGHHVVAPDLYDLGSSMKEWARAVLELVDGDVVLVGASMGGYCALHVARLAPERVRALVLAGSRPEADPPERRPVREEWIRLTQEGGPPALWAAMRETAFSGSEPRALPRVEALALDQDGIELATAIAAIRDRADSSDVVASLRVPFLLVIGDADPLVTPDAATEIVVAAPDGRLVVFEQTGHLPSLERPDEFNAVLSGLLAEL